MLLDRETDLPAWIGVRTGLLGRNESYVPLEGATEDGGDVRGLDDRDRRPGARPHDR